MDKNINLKGIKIYESMCLYRHTPEEIKKAIESLPEEYIIKV